MNIQQLRQSLKLKWVSYYEQNRSWLEKMRIWGTYDHQRRPNSGFILATLSVLEPDLNELFPFMLELNNNPDQIVAALGLNFNPEEHLHLIEPDDTVTNQNNSESPLETFHSDKPLASGILATNTESKPLVPSDQPLASGIFATNTESKPLVSIAAFAEVENQPLASSMAAVTEVESQPVTPLPVVKEYNEIPINEVESKSMTTVAVASVVESNGIVKQHQKDTPPESNLSPVNKSRSLPNWIDDFCQGAGWDREEATFIPFWRRQEKEDRRKETTGEKLKQYLYLSLFFSVLSCLLMTIYGSS